VNRPTWHDGRRVSGGYEKVWPLMAEPDRGARALPMGPQEAAHCSIRGNDFQAKDPETEEEKAEVETMR